MWRGNIQFGLLFFQAVCLMFIVYLIIDHKGLVTDIAPLIASLFVAEHVFFQIHTYFFFKFMKEYYIDTADKVVYGFACAFLLCVLCFSAVFAHEWVALKLANKDWPYWYLEQATWVHWGFALGLVGGTMALIYGLRIAISSAIILGKPK